MRCHAVATLSLLIGLAPTGCASGLSRAHAQAEARARAEVAEARGDDGVGVLRQLEPCSADLVGALSDRAAGRDPVAELATRLLLRGAGEPLFRGGSGHGREEVVRGGDASARRLAMHEARREVGPADVPWLLDAARRDPDPEVRWLAIDALGRTGSVDAVIGLEDVWAWAREDDRIAIVGAWARLARREAGARCDAAHDAPACIARRRLSRVVGEGSGSTALIAAFALIDAIAIEREPSEGEVSAVGAARGLLERTIDGGPSTLRVLAIEGAPLDDARVLEAVVDAGGSTDSVIAAAARARIAATDSPATSGERAAAREGLVASGTSTDPEVRRRVAVGYARAGAIPEALAFLADRDATVRAAAACAVMRATEK